jgi:AAA domain, putative AbiEii toxin, Type IV TA system
MIRWYRFKNFYSFRDTTTVSFELDGKAPRDDLSFDSPEGARLNYIMAVLGPNASGKTQLLKPLAFLQWLVCSSFTAPADGETLLFSPHFFASEDEPTKIEVEFESDGRVFRYFVEANPHHILEESLKELGTRSFKTLFRRQRTGRRDEDETRFTLRGFDFSLSQARKVRDRVSLIAWAHQHGVPLATLINSAFGRIRTNIASFGKVDRTPMGMFDTAHFFRENERLFDRARSIIRRLDLGISDIELIEEKVLVGDKTHRFTAPMAVHEHADSPTIKLPMALESTGTCAAFQLLQALLPLCWILVAEGLAFLDPGRKGEHED